MFKKLINSGLILVLFVMVVIFSFRVFAADFPVTVVDDTGQEITVLEKPARIISLAPNMTELLFALGLNEEIVGVTSFANYPEEALEKEKIGTIVEPNIEKILSLKPDLVFAAGINKLETVEHLRKLGINVAGFNPGNIDDTLIIIKKIGKLTGQDVLAREMVTELYIKLSQIQLLVEGVLKEKERPRVFYEIWSDPLYTAGAGTFIDDIITTAGGINIGSKAQGAWPQYSLEKLLLENPDVYVSSLHSAPEEVTPEKIKERKLYQSLKAIKNDRVYIIDQDIISRPSPRIIEGLKLFVKALFPELTDEINRI
jgi:iron complex transport system substrate-binding protein